MKRKTKIALLSGLSATILLVCSGCADDKITYTGRTKLFNPGEHMVTVGTELKIYDNQLLPQVEGYKIFSVSIDANNQIVIVYENTETVECVQTDKGYTELGIPTSKEASLKLHQEN